MAKALSLADYASVHPARGVVCQVCISPHRKEIEAGLAKGIGGTLIMKWLREEKGVLIVSRNSIDNHKRTHVQP